MENLVVIQAAELDDRIGRAVEVALEKMLTKKVDVRHLTRQQVADRLHVSLPTVHEYVNRGLLQCYKIGGRSLFSETEVDAALQHKQIFRYKHTVRRAAR